MSEKKGQSVCGVCSIAIEGKVFSPQAITKQGWPISACKRCATQYYTYSEERGLELKDVPNG
jgi:hypothetical protein